MKKIFLALTMFAFVFPALPQAKGADVSIDFFYNNLSGGNWIEAGDYGYGWQPDVATSDPNWRPYADGYWAYTDVGWTWVSYEDFGWATYHYGRWANLADYGWVWFPGSDLEWGPAWVSWRTGGDYVGWAPLPPRGPGIAYAGGPIGGRVDIEFDIGPAYYNFIDARFIGEPVLRDRIFPYSQNVTYIDNTVNVTNITVQNNVVYNYGPDYNTLSSYSSRPIQRLKIERGSSADLSAAAKTGALTKVQGDRLMVAAPQRFSKAAAGVAPPKVKAKVAQPKIEKGWTGVANEAQLKQKIKTENPKNIPPPTRAAARTSPAGTLAPAGSASPAVSAAPAASVAPFERGKGKGKGRQPQPGLTGTPGVAPTGSPAGTATPFERGKRPGKPGRQPQPGLTGTPGTTPAEGISPAGAASPGTVPTAPERGKRKGKFGEPMATPGQPGEAPAGAQTTPFPGKHKGKTAPPEFTPSTGAPAGAPETKQPPGKQKGRFERGTASPTPGQPGGALNEPAQGKHRGRGPEQAGPSPAQGAPPYETTGGRQRGQGAQGQAGASPVTGTGPGEPQGGKQKGQRAYGQPGTAPAGGSAPGTEPGQGKPAGGKKKGEKGSPTPGPQ
jgi:hypothetical protein